jgi:hypothetical protein
MSIRNTIQSLNDRINHMQSNLRTNDTDILLLQNSTTDTLNALKYFQSSILDKIKYELNKVQNESNTFNSLETSLLYLSINEMIDQESFGLEMSERMIIIQRDMNNLAINVIGEDLDSLSLNHYK